MAITAFLAASAAVDAQAQCVMCFRNASAQNRARGKALNAGILVLGVPPLVILGGLVWLGARRNRM
jgi:hypothetical protein